jgi:2-keto-3-deoxy-L-rhamnonate aldolase RhmA
LSYAERGQIPAKAEKWLTLLGTVVGSADSCITEALSYGMDFVWLDMEHPPLTVERVQSHLITTKGTDCTGLVRVPWSDAVSIKRVLDVGADGVIVQMIRCVQEAEQAVAACRYPPEGIRGYGPRRPSAFGRRGGPEFCRSENESVLTILQIEHIDAVNSIDAIVAVPGIASLVLGPNDLSGSMGLMG